MMITDSDTGSHVLQACLECLEHLLRLTVNQQQAAQAGAVLVFLALIGPHTQHTV